MSERPGWSAPRRAQRDWLEDSRGRHMDWHQEVFEEMGWPSEAQALPLVEATTPEPETDETAQARALAFKEKLASIQFPGRGKANRSRQIASHGKAVSDADRERRV